MKKIKAFGIFLLGLSYVLVPSMAFAAGSTLPEKILSTTITWVGAISMIILVVLLVKDIIGIVKGNVNIGAVVVKVLSILAIVGIMYAASSFDTFGNMFSNVFTSTVTEENLPKIDGE